MRIITAQERLKSQSGVKMQIWGESGVGKTTLASTLPANETIVIDMEAGLISLRGWGGCSIQVNTWPECRDIACWASGPEGHREMTEIYSQAHYDAICKKLAGPMPTEIKNLFIDSTTYASRYCLAWCKTQPQAFSERSGKPDLRGAYGLLGQEFLAWVEKLQNIGRLNVFLVGGLEQKMDDFNRPYWKPMLEGAKSQESIPYVFDEVATMTVIAREDGDPYRALVCQKTNQWGFPGKDRSGRLDTVEKPNLTNILEKIQC